MATQIFYPTSASILQRIISGSTLFSQTILGVQPDAIFFFGDTGSISILTSSNVIVGTSISSSYSATSSWAVQSQTASITLPRVYTLTDQDTIQTDTALGEHFRVGLSGSRTLANPTGSVDGLKISWEFIQDDTGTRTITLDSKFVTGSDFSIQLNQTGSKRDFMTALYNAVTDKWYILGFVKGY